ncbi:MAG: hypothetical protein OQK73_08210 [Gammaproteobacteria bacterium]|nr:hypothetical protein [Gammaproteobacteria bacterium]
MLFDTRHPKEFCGDKRIAARGGHNPCAVNIEWSDAMDKNRELHLKPESELRQRLGAKVSLQIKQWSPIARLITAQPIPASC